MSAEIALVAIGKIKSCWLATLCPLLEAVFGRRCVTGAPLPTPDYAYVPQRDQYAAEPILQQLQRREAERVLGLADLDLFIPELNFVFGLADPVSRGAIIALPRLRESFYGGHEDEATFLERMLKEAVHELGHTYGLKHCDDRFCVMAFSNSLMDTDTKRAEFCERCRKKLEK
jgi:archaemetzincin